MKNSLDRINQRIDLLLNKLEKIDKFAGTIGAGTGPGAGSGLMSGSLSSVSTVAQPMSRGGAVMSALGQMGAGLGTMAVGVSQMLPDLSMTIARRAGFYQAGVASGGVAGLGEIERTTRLGLGKFSTSQGSDAAVAAMLTSRGMNPASQGYKSTITAVGQAARYLNMSNEVAASALENLSAGPTSAMMMRNFGVWTTDPRTGENLSQGQIFSQLASRWGGANASPEDVLGSLRSGNLGSNIRNSGLDPAQQALLSQYMIDRSRGIEMDLSNPDAISEAIARNDKLGTSNPLLEQYRQNSLDNQLMERATEPYLEGMKKASDALAVLKTGLEALPDSIYEAKAAFDFFTGDNVGAGSIVALTGSINLLIGAMGLLTAALGISAGTSIFGGPGGNKDKAPKGGKGGVKGFFSKMPWLATAARVAGTIGLVLSLGGDSKKETPEETAERLAQRERQQDAADAGYPNSPLRQYDQTPSSSPLDAFGGGGSIRPRTSSSFSQSIGMAARGSSRANYARRATGGGGNIDPGPQGNSWTGAFNEQRPYGRHTGVDIAMPIGTPLKAVMDGVVSYAGSGSGSRSRGLYVEIKHADGYSTLYAHLNNYVVKKGDTVVVGNLIGYSGNTGFSTGPHLHFELRKGGTPINPERFVGPQLYGGASATWAKSSGGTSGSSSIDSNMTSGENTAAAAVDSFFGVTTSGVIANEQSAASILESVLGGSNGSLGNLPGTAPNTNIPQSISGPDTSGMMGTSSEELAGNNSQTAVGGGYEPGGLQEVDSTLSSMSMGAKKSRSVSGSSGTQVTIHVNIAQASPEEAKRFAKLVKEQLEEEKMLAKVGNK